MERAAGGVGGTSLGGGRWASLQRALGHPCAAQPPAPVPWLPPQPAGCPDTGRTETGNPAPHGPWPLPGEDPDFQAQPQGLQGPPSPPRAASVPSPGSSGLLASGGRGVHPGSAPPALHASTCHTERSGEGGSSGPSPSVPSGLRMASDPLTAGLAQRSLRLRGGGTCPSLRGHKAGHSVSG